MEGRTLSGFASYKFSMTGLLGARQRKKEKGYIMRTFFLILLVICLVAASVGAVLCFSVEWNIRNQEGFGVTALCAALICAYSLVIVYKGKIKEMERSFEKKLNEEVISHSYIVRELEQRSTQDEWTYRAQRDALVVELAQLTVWVYTTRKPTDANMRDLRNRIIGFIFEELKRGAWIRSVTDNVLPFHIRDVVEAKVKNGEFNLTTGPEWQRKLVQYSLLSDKTFLPERDADAPVS